MTNNQCMCPHSPIYKTPQGCSKCLDEQVQQQQRWQQLQQQQQNQNLLWKVFDKLRRLNLVEAFLEMDDETLQKILLLL